MLLHEHTDHHALQCAAPMTLESKCLAVRSPCSSFADLTSLTGLNQKLTDLFATQAECMSREDYFARYGSV